MLNKSILYHPNAPKWLSEMLRYQGRNQLAVQMFAWHESLYHHAITTVMYAEAIGRELGYAKEELDLLTQGSFIHDVGKIAWPGMLIDKLHLDDTDLKLVRAHPIAGAYYLREHWPDVPELVCRIVKEHHERVDGSGYPNGLKGNEVNSLSVIVAAVEVFTALLEHRPYRDRSFTRGEALMELDRQGFPREIIGVLEGLTTGAAERVIL